MRSRATRGRLEAMAFVLARAAVEPVDWDRLRDLQLRSGRLPRGQRRLLQTLANELLFGPDEGEKPRWRRR